MYFFSGVKKMNIQLSESPFIMKCICGLIPGFYMENVNVIRDIKLDEKPPQLCPLKRREGVYQSVLRDYLAHCFMALNLILYICVIFQRAITVPLFLFFSSKKSKMR